MGNYFEVFKDSLGKELITVLTSDTIVPAGGTASFKIYIKNISPFEMQHVILSSTDPDVQFIPNTIPYMDIGTICEVTVIWSPSKTREIELNASIKADFEIIKRAR